jgi:ribosomal protein L31
MNYKSHPKSKSTTLIMNNGASYPTQWILANPSQGLEVDPNNNILWKPYQDSSDLNTAKRISQFNERFGSLGLEDSEGT